MAEFILGADADERDLRPQMVERGSGDAVRAPMVRHEQHVHVGDRPIAHETIPDHLFGIPGEER